MLITSIERVDSFNDTIGIFISVLLLRIPFLCIIGIVLSVVFWKREKFFEAAIIQFLSFYILFLTVFLTVTWMIFGML